MTFKELSFKKKLEHIWEYYRWMILGIIFVVFAGTSITYTMLKPKPESYAGLAVYRAHIDQGMTADLTNDLNKALGLDEKQTVNISNYFFQNNDEYFNVEMEQKFVTYLYSLELNAVAAEKSDMELFIDSEYIAPLADYLTEEEIKSLGEKGLVMYRKDPLDGKEKPFAVDVSESRVFNKYKVFNGEKEKGYIAAVPVKGKEQQTIKVMKEIMK